MINFVKTSLDHLSIYKCKFKFIIMENLNLRSVEEILSFAILQEQKAADLYNDLAKKTLKVEVKILWEQLALDELKHKIFMENMLEQLKAGEAPSCCKQPEYLNYEPLSIPEKDLTEEEEAIVMAIKRDLDVIQLYKDLAAKIGDAVCANVLLNIANQETSHKQSLMRELNMFNYFG